MKYTVKIMLWFNRVLMSIFLVLLLAGIFENDSLSIAALFAIPLGFMQVLFALRLLLALQIIGKFNKNILTSYLFFVSAYFLMLFSKNNSHYGCYKN